MDYRKIEGVIFNIARFCINDGPGIRTTVFFKGCPLRCRWCHNPESFSHKPQLMYMPDLCISCGNCVKTCPQNCHEIVDNIHILNRPACTACGLCTECPTGALKIIGQSVTAGDVLNEVICDKHFYEVSGGGITLSGGEPLFQPQFATAILHEARRAGLHTCVETGGFAPMEIIKNIAMLTDLFLFDWKITNPAYHKSLTGQDNIKIKENLLALERIHADVVLRVPFIPGINDDEQHAEGVAVMSRLSCVRHIEVMPYHNLGKAKAGQLGYSKFQAEEPDKEMITDWIKMLSLKTAKPVILV